MKVEFDLFELERFLIGISFNSEVTDEDGMHQRLDIGLLLFTISFCYYYE
jgi:hypothetical protein